MLARTSNETLGPLLPKLEMLRASDVEWRKKTDEMPLKIHGYEVLVSQLKVCLHGHEIFLNQPERNILRGSRILSITIRNGHIFFTSITEKFISIVLGRIKGGKVQSKRRSRGFSTRNG